MDRIDRLGLWTLEERRNRADLIEVFKICNGYTTLSLEAFFEVDSYGRTRGHNGKTSETSLHKRHQEILLLAQSYRQVE